KPEEKIIASFKAMAYQLYRNTTLRNSLQESLDELIQSQHITPQIALQVLLQFDKAINSALAQRVRNRVNFRGSLNTYRDSAIMFGLLY
ncbi:mCG140073, partial [Mus musculus]